MLKAGAKSEVVSGSKWLQLSGCGFESRCHLKLSILSQKKIFIQKWIYMLKTGEVAEFWKGVGLQPACGNNPSVEGWIV